MRHRWNIFKKYAPWLFLLLGMDSVSALILWIANIKAFRALIGVMILGTLLLFGILLIVLSRREKQRQQAFLYFLQFPDEQNEKNLLRLSSDWDGQMIRILGCELRKKQSDYEQLLAQISDYEEYVEAWAHETKTPLSLLTLLLDNRRDEFPENVSFKLDYIRNRIQESVNQMLFYARLKGPHKDFLFEEMDLCECITEVLEDYQPLLVEKGFAVMIDVPNVSVYTDRRGFSFLLCQIVSNALKYCDENRTPKLSFAFSRTEDQSILCISDNGIGVRSSDLPYIFEKGFSGNSGENRQKATGMGLYLASEIARHLKLSLEADSKWRSGFQITIRFPVIKQG